MKKIKILRIIARLNIGGPAIHTVLLTEGLDKNKFDSLLVCGSIDKNEGDMHYYAIEKNIKPIFVPEFSRKLNFFKDLIAFAKIYKIIIKEKPHIIHTHTAKAGTLGRLAGILYNLFLPCDQRLKLIHTFHGHVFHGYFNKFNTRIFLFIERFLAFFTYKIITVSESVKKELISLHISREDKIKVIPLGFELDKFLNIPSKDNNNFFNIGIVGRLEPIKNHRLFLETAAKVIRDNPYLKLRFKITGDGQLRKELEEYSHILNMNTYVDFLGWQKDLTKVYSDLDIVVLTSINEGTPVSLIEAMASGKAIVATDVGGVKDLLGREIDTDIKTKANSQVLERGVIVRFADARNFAATLEFLLQNKELRTKMGLLGREFARNKFTKDRLIRDIENLYEEIAGIRATDTEV